MGCDENVDDIIIASNAGIVAGAAVRQYACLKRCRFHYGVLNILTNA